MMLSTGTSASLEEVREARGALALGATGAGIGRPQVWGLAAFGQPGVEAVIDILNRELATIMRQAGTPTIASITGAQVLRSGA